MNLIYRTQEFLRSFPGKRSDLDTADAAERIKKGIWFRGTNVWILACAIIVASVGLNVNSTAVIIGAMLISPVMGPILGIGLAIGTNDLNLLKLSARNLLVMVLISLSASWLYFLLSPLSLADPTELTARTSPTIYDVLIAFFGGAAGILENSKKERGTVLSGVAIATALMPPLCTAGFGLATLDFKFFIGAMYLFLINTIFIATATYLGVKMLHFPCSGSEGEMGRLRNRRRLITTLFTIILIPSFFTAYKLIKDNQFTNNVRAFVAENRIMGKTYIYDYNIYKDDGNKVSFSLAGEPLNDKLRDSLLNNALKHNIKAERIVLLNGTTGLREEQMDDIVSSIYAHTDESILARDAHIMELQERVERLDSIIRAHFSDSVTTPPALAITDEILPEAGQE